MVSHLEDLTVKTFLCKILGRLGLTVTIEDNWSRWWRKGWRSRQ